MADSRQPQFVLKLFVAGKTANSLRAIANLHAVCEEKLAGHYSVEVIDVLEHPELAEANYILATPTLVREMPHSMQQILGDLSNRDNVLLGLNIYSD